MQRLDVLFSKSKKREFKKGDIILSQNNKSDYIYQIEKGFVVSYTKGDNGRRNIQTILKPKDIFPLLVTLKNINKHVTIEALTGVSLLYVHKDVFLKEINKNTESTLGLVDIMSNYLDIYFHRVENLEYQSVQKKLISRLIFFAERFGSKMGKTIVLNLPITHQLIAESINVSRENVTRELKILQDFNLVHFNNRQMVVVSLSNLKKKLK